MVLQLGAERGHFRHVRRLVDGTLYVEACVSCAAMGRTTDAKSYWWNFRMRLKRSTRTERVVGMLLLAALLLFTRNSQQKDHARTSEALDDRLAVGKGRSMIQGQVDPHPWTGEAIPLSWEPRAFLYKNFLSHEECEHMKKLAQPTLKKSFVVNRDTGKSFDSNVRTSHGTFLARGQDPIVARIERRIAKATHIPEENGEGMQILRYKDGQKYEPHLDYFFDEWNKSPEKGGQRIATFLSYLETVEEGGETVFPEAVEKPEYGPDERSECGRKGLSVKPVKGDAVLFFSVTTAGKEDPRSSHGSCPVIKGTKWSAAKWMHQGPFNVGKKHTQSPGQNPDTDSHPQCEQWAQQGECKKNPSYMLQFCKISCTGKG